MVRYLKYIVIIFTAIGLVAVSFFFMQNKKDILLAMEHEDYIDYDYLTENCQQKQGNSIYPCLKVQFNKYAEKVSLTGVSMGLKMVFNVMDEDKEKNSFYSSKDIRDLHYSIHYLEINNIAISQPYKRYHGFKNLYGGYLASLQQFYKKSYEFSENIIIGLEGSEGLKKIIDQSEYQRLELRLKSVKERYFALKKQIDSYLDLEIQRLSAQ